MDAAEFRATVDERRGAQVHRWGTDEPGDEGVHRAVVKGARGVALLENPVVEHGDPVAHGHRLDLVVGDVHGGHAQPALQRGDLRAGRRPKLRVQVGQWLVHEEHLRFADDRASHRDALALSAGERLGFAVEERFQVQQLRRVLHPATNISFGHTCDLQREAHVVGHAHVRVERVVLEHHRDVPVARREVGHLPRADADGSHVDVFEPGQHPQAGGLAAAGRPDEDQELAVGDLEVQLVDRGLLGTGVVARRAVISDRRHQCFLSSFACVGWTVATADR
jgi:hypothetical protein